MVPAGWEHPTYRQLKEAGVNISYSLRELDAYAPVFDRSYLAACREWLDDCKAWDDGTHADIVNNPERKTEFPFYWDWSGNAPDQSSYRFGKWDFKSEDATCYQIYETVSEGSPTSPVLRTLDALRAWLVKQGHTPEQAAAFAEDKWVPSMMISGGKITMGIDVAAAIREGN